MLHSFKWLNNCRVKKLQKKKWKMRLRSNFKNGFDICLWVLRKATKPSSNSVIVYNVIAAQQAKKRVVAYEVTNL